MNMAKVRLDSATVLTAHCEKGKRKTDYYDTQITGFVLECRESGGKTYYLRFQDPQGRQKQHRIGAVNDITFDQARKAARRLRSEVVLGGNPAAEKEARRAIPTYGELADKHLAYIETQARSYKTIEGYMRRHIKPRWAKVLISDITQPDVAKWLAEKKAEGYAPATVEKMRVLLGRSLELSVKWGLPGVDRNPVRGISLGPINNARERFLSDAEAKRLHAAVADSANTQLKFIVGLLLLTGARVSELLKAEWRHVNLEGKRWLIPTSKTGKPRHVPLSAAAIELIEALPRFKDCPYLVPNPVTLKPFVSIKHSWQTARKAAGVPDVRIHDLRHSAASFMVNAGIDLHAVGKVLGHANIASTMRYAHLDNNTLLAAVEAGSEKLGTWAA